MTLPLLPVSVGLDCDLSWEEDSRSLSEAIGVSRGSVCEDRLLDCSGVSAGRFNEVFLRLVSLLGVEVEFLEPPASLRVPFGGM
jgi:hypothetical protein